MKRILLLLSVAISIQSMEMVEKEKGRITPSSSASSSGSDAVVSPFENVDLASASPQKEIIIVRSLEDLETIMKSQGVTFKEKASKRLSIVYMPNIKLDEVKKEVAQKPAAVNKDKDVEKGLPSEPNDFEEIFDFFSKCILDKTQVDITPIKRRLIEEFEKAHNTPPPTPHDDEKTQKVQKTKKAVDVLRTATQYQASARTQRAQQVKQSPILHQAREPKPLEILSTVASVANDPAVHDNLQTVEHLVMGLLSQKLGETQDSKTRTTWVTAAIGGGSSIAAAVIAYLATKKTC